MKNCKNGETREFDIPAGEHELFIKMGRSKSEKIQVTNEDIVLVQPNNTVATIPAIISGIFVFMIAIDNLIGLDRIWLIVVMLVGILAILIPMQSRKFIKIEKYDMTNSQ